MCPILHKNTAIFVCGLWPLRTMILIKPNIHFAVSVSQVTYYTCRLGTCTIAIYLSRNIQVCCTSLAAGMIAYLTKSNQCLNLVPCYAPSCILTSLRSASYVGWQRGTARICGRCWPPAAGLAAVDRCLLSAGRSAANQPAAAAAVDRWDRQTDERTNIKVLQ